MPVPARLLRDLADDLPGARPRPSARDEDTKDRILAAATTLMANFGRPGLSMAGFATAIRLSSATIRRHFVDLDTILHEILTRHLSALAASFGDIAFDLPDRPAARRALYVQRTRTCLNAPTEAHLLLLRERHALPPDLAASIETLRTLVGDMLCPAHPEIALALLDTPDLQPPQVEIMLATLSPALAAASPEPAAPPQTTAKPPRPIFIPTLVIQTNPARRATAPIPPHPPPQQAVNWAAPQHP